MPSFPPVPPSTPNPCDDPPAPLFSPDNLRDLDRLLRRLKTEGSGSGEITIRVSHGFVTAIFLSTGFHYQRRNKTSPENPV